MCTNTLKTYEMAKFLETQTNKAHTKRNNLNTPISIKRY